MISSINTNFCGIFGGLEDQVWNLEKGEMFLSRTDGQSVPPSRTVRAKPCVRVVHVELLRHVPLPAPPPPPPQPATLPSPPSAFLSTHRSSSPLLLLQLNYGGETHLSHQIHHHSCWSSSKDHGRTSPTSFSTIFTSPSPETKEKAIPKLLHLLPQAPMEELSSIYSNAALRQQAAHYSCSTRHRWAFLTHPALPFALNQAPQISFEPLGFLHHWWPRAQNTLCLSNLSLGINSIHS
jgi:hypothetical protein